MTTVAVVNDASWTFHNYGPLTTTFTPAPSCSGTSHIGLGTIKDDIFAYEYYNVQCETTAWPDCAPPSTVTPSPTTSLADGYDDTWTASVGNYYSPGLYCPSGWETVGLAGRDGDEAYTTSGAMSYGTSHWTPDFDYMPTLLAKNLKPSETVALCCPSGFTANPLGDCFTTVPSYTPTSVCYVYEDILRSVDRSTSVYTTDGTKIVTVVTTTTTIDSISTESRVVDNGERFKERYTPIISVSAVTLIHHESDVVATGKTGTAAATAAGSSTVVATGTATGTAATTSNAAVRFGPRVSSWNGFGAVLGVSLAAAALGAATVLPF
ncbi:hypothetical protein PEBR_11350 [Penicillium brasilianum]|uniref:Uncharacterized protein n=1 Tax=Penicillium brasilianum TaxID=104259 RepID=A0A1S9RTR5_PENBI|nr:hypothetical protein PEBR_11350 [Penicillium brasilianum]